MLLVGDDRRTVNVQLGGEPTGEPTGDSNVMASIRAACDSRLFRILLPGTVITGQFAFRTIYFGEVGGVPINSLPEFARLLLILFAGTRITGHGAFCTT